ncbi:MAG: ABC transporter permease [Victivallales bacterium]|nr:ABC transporter permease [Victivallales bacterium]
MENNESNGKWMALRRVFKGKLAAFAGMTLLLYVICGIACEVHVIYCRSSGEIPVYMRGEVEDAYLGPSSEHWMGTDYRGKDVFWKGFFGIRTALKIGFIGSAFAAVIGVFLGVSAGYFSGCVDDIVVWLYSTFAAMPTLLFILAFALLLQKGFLSENLASVFRHAARTMNVDQGMLALYIGIGLTGWVGLCRVVRGEALRLKCEGYIQAARALGFSPARIVLRHLMPNLFHLVIIYFTMRFAYAIMTEIIVSYLGLGVELEPSWGVMIADGQQRLWRGVWWEVAAATGFMFFLVLSLHILGDSLRDSLDPRLRN